MYNGRLYIYFIQHKNDAIYTTLNTQRGLYILLPENSKIRPGCMQPCWPKQRLCHCCWQASSLHGDLKFSHVLLHVVSARMWNIVWTVICNTFSKYASRKTSWKFRKIKIPCQQRYAIQYNKQKNNKFSNYRCCHQGELLCSGDRTARPLYKKKIITSFWDWRITCVKQNNQWTNVITSINTTASHTLQSKGGFVLHSHWNTTLDHSQRTSSVVKCCTETCFRTGAFFKQTV